MTPQSTRPLVPVNTVAEVTGFEKRTIYRAIERGLIPHRRMGRSVLVFPEWLDEFMTCPAAGSAA